MTELLSTILSFNSSSARLAWLRQKHPTVSRKLIENVLHEVQQDSTHNSQSLLNIAKFIATAADLWQDDPTRASSLRIEAKAIRHDTPETALQRYRDAVHIYQRFDMPNQAADAALGIAATLRSLGQYSEATTECEQAIIQFHSVNDVGGLGRSYMNLGILNSMQGKFDDALHNYEKARGAFRQIEDLHWLALIDVNEANVLEEMKQFDDAKDRYIRAQHYFLELESTETALKIEHNLAYLYFSLGEYQKALQLYTAVGKQFKKLNNRRNEAMADLYRSEVYIALNQWERALKIVEKVQPLFEEKQMNLELGQALINQAVSLANMQRSKEALACCEQARNIMPAGNKSRIWQEMVDLYQSAIALQIGHMDDAEALATRAADRFDRMGINYRLAQCQQILGEVATQKADFAEAETHFSNALQIAQTLNLSVLLDGCHHGLGKIYRLQGKFEKAYDHYQQAVDSLERLQNRIGAEDYKISYRNDKLKIYHEFVELCLTKNDTFYIEKAFEIIERSRARTLLDSLVNSDRNQAKTQKSSPSSSHLQQLREELNWYYRQLFTPDDAVESADAVSKLNRAIAERESKLTELIQALHNPDNLETQEQRVSVLTMAEIQQQLPAKTTVISYFVMKQSLIVFRLDQTEFQALTIELPREQLTELLQNFQFQLNRFQISQSTGQRFIKSMKTSINSLLEQLYELLVRPVLANIEKGTHLVFVPYGPLHSVPFQALYNGHEYLIERYSISYAPSATFFSLLIQEEKNLPPKDLLPPLLFGLNDELISNAEIETHVIHKFYPAAEIFNGSKFLRSKLVHNKKMRSFIHLATHGNLRTQYPKLSALKAADGWITLYDIEQMPETAKLITLSACDTGQNAVNSGDELIGFYKSFFASGAHTLILSLWPLDDKTTLTLMTTFYQNLSMGKPVYLAQREAQLELIKTGHHPFYWAPFFIVGNHSLLIDS